MENDEPGKESKVNEKRIDEKVEEIVENGDHIESDTTEVAVVVSAAAAGDTESKAAVEDSDKTKEMSSEEKDRVNVKVNADVKDEIEDSVKTEEKYKKDEKVVNGKFLTKDVQC